MAMRPDEFYEHALSAADAEGRLPLARMTEWDISPFDQAGLQRRAAATADVRRSRPRHGEDPADCGSCARRDEGIWLDDHWRLTRIGGVGVPLVLDAAPARALRPGRPAGRAAPPSWAC